MSELKEILLDSPQPKEKSKELSEEQKKQVLELWNSSLEPPSLGFLVQKVFNDSTLDGKTIQAKLIKEYLATRNLAPKTLTRDRTKNKTDEIILDDAKKLFITNNVSTMGPVEIAQTLFNNKNLTALNAEVRVICEYIKTLSPTNLSLKNNNNINDIPLEDYFPPNTLNQVVERTNKCINYLFDKDKILAKQKRDLLQLLNYLHNARLIKQINNYSSESDRKSFEDAFIRYTYDKPDLSQEEVDQYIVLAHEVVISFKIQKRVEQLQKLLDKIIENSDEQHVRFSMTLTETITSIQQEYNSCVTRQQKLLDALTEKRSNRISKEIKDTASVLNFLNLWKEEESRKALLKLAEKEEEALKKEVDKLEGMEEIRVRIFGLTREESIYGSV